MTEIEIRGFIPANQFETLKENLQADYGNPQVKKRLSFVTGDYSLRNLETRLRITDSKFDIAQKVGDIGATQRSEYEMRFEDISPLHILYLCRMAQRLAMQSPDYYAVVMQHENYLFVDEKVEIKIYKQFCKGEFFGFEIEAFDGNESTIHEIADKYGLEYGETYDSDSVIRKRNTEINMPAEEISDDDLLSIIKTYLETKDEHKN